MRRAFRVSLVLAVLGAMVLVAAGNSTAARHHGHRAPRWVRHVRNYPGGISNGVRAYLTKGVIQARQAARQGLFSPSSPANTGGIGGNVQVNTEPVTPKMPQNETAVAYSLDALTTAVAASNDYIDGGLGIYTTHDGGNHWNSVYLTPRVPETGDFCTGGDPSVVYSARDHAFYASQLCFMRFHPESEVQVIESTDGGDHWTGARFSSEVITNWNGSGFDPSVFYDKELLAVDNNPASPHYGRLYVTFIKFHFDETGFGDYCPVQLAYTDDVDPNNDGSLTDTVWSHTPVVPDNPGGNGTGPTANQWAIPVVDDQGGLDISYASEDCNTSFDRALLFKRSTNGGASFGPQRKINKPGQWKDNPNLSDLLPNKNARIPLSPSMDFDPQLGALVYVVQNNINAGSSGADISGAFSTDYGTTWSDMQFVSHLGSTVGAGAPNDQFFPWVSVDPQGGIHVIWFDNRNDPGNTLIETFELFTGTLSFAAPNTDISTASWNPNNSFFSSGSFIGDYNGLDAVDNAIEYPVWTDGRNTPGPPFGQTDVFTVPNQSPEP